MSNMDLKELYMSIEDSLTDETIDRLIDIYSNNNGYIYGGLTNVYSNEIPTDRNKLINVTERDKFFSNCFNTWKRNVCSMSKEEFIELARNGKYGKDFVKLRNYVLHLPDINSYEEMNNLYYGNNTPSEIKDLLEKYGWNSIGYTSGWIHTDSRYINAKRTPRVNVEHRLYINTDSESLYSIINLFMKACSDKGIPFYFKFGLNDGSRDDTIPIYSDSEHLLDYIEILNDIKKNHPELAFYKPPILCGKINGFIGYGSEPDEEIVHKRTSFNEIRANLIEDSIKKCRDNWIKNNLRTNYGTKEKPRYINQIIIQKAVLDFINKLTNRYNDYIRMEQNRRKANGYKGNKTIEEEVFDQLHYTPYMIDNVHFKNRVFQELYNQINSNLNDRIDALFDISININGKNYHYSSYDFNKTLNSFTGSISRHDSSFRDSVKNEIRSNCGKYGIMPGKFCCDRTRVDSMKEVNRARRKANGERVLIDNSYVPLTDEQIEEARRRIGPHTEPKRRFTLEEMESLIMGDSSTKGNNNDRIL